MDERLNELDPIVLIREFVEAFGSQRAFALHCKISESFLSDILSGRRAITDNVLNAVGLRRVSYYERVGE